MSIEEQLRDLVDSLASPVTLDEVTTAPPGANHRTGVVLGLAAVLVLACLGWLVVRNQDDAADVANDRVVSVGPSTPDDEPGGTTTPGDQPSGTQPALSCDSDLDQIGELLDSGLPTYDYSPAADLADLVQRSDAVVTGTIDSVVRTTDQDAADAGDPNNSWTVITFSDAELLLASPAAEAAANRATFSIQSLWAQGLGPDPLDDPVSVDGVSFVAFLHHFPEAPGDLSIGPEGLAVACTGSNEPALALLAGLPADTADRSLDDLVATVTRVVEAGGPNDATGGVDGPVMFSPSSDSAVGMLAKVEGVIALDGECLYLERPDDGIRYPVLWPYGVRWNGEAPGVELPSGELAAIGEAVHGAGGYLQAADVQRIAGTPASEVAAACAEGPYREIAVFNPGSEVRLTP